MKLLNNSKISSSSPLQMLYSCDFNHEKVHVQIVSAQIVSAQFVSAQIVSAQIVSGTNCIGNKLYQEHIVSGTNCIGSLSFHGEGYFFVKTH
jgi:hypothetical protein